MLFIIVGLVVLSVAAVIVGRNWLFSGEDSAALGWMSEQWLVEHRASHSP